MNYAYIRVSSDKQTVDNQRFTILKYCDEKKLVIDQWIEETASGAKKVENRKLGDVLGKMSKGDLLIVSELSRLGRNLMEVMTILNECMSRDTRVHAVTERYELGDNINSKVLAFAFSLSAEIERNLISQRTKEALSKKKKEGVKLGRPKGSLSSKTKLTGKEQEIQKLLDKKISVSGIARLLDVNRGTVKNFIDTRLDS